MKDKHLSFPVAYACYNKDRQTRMSSTSGGIFTVLASYFMLEKNAVVFGAAFDKDFNVKHIKIDSIDQLSLLRGSKYPQSNICDSFSEVRKMLDCGINVFFTGTPCHIVALKNYLARNYDNLYTMDFVCHGVGSNSIWRGYVGELKKSGEIQRITFKAKPHGWKKWYFKVDFKDGKTWQRRGSMTMFMRSYLSYTNIRPSCYECHFKGLQRCSDFTISDCWGVGEGNKEINDDRGLSAILLQNRRAVQIFDSIKNCLKYQEYDAEELMAGNWTTFKSVRPNPIRFSFFKHAFETGTAVALRNFFRPSIKNWMAYYYKRFMGIEK